MAKGKNVLEQISKKLDLPSWWVESVAVEYFDCRQYLTDKEIWTFDFSLLKNEDIEQIPKKKVVVSSTGITLFQNIRREDLGPRLMLALVGAPIMPLPATTIPNGEVATYFVAQQTNSIDVWDWKLAFDQRALVFDNGRFYQWKISEFYSIPGTNRGWFRSDFLDLQLLKRINDEIQELRNQPRPSEPVSLREMREKVAEKYAELETIRAPLRESILQYHESKKSETTAPTDQPPVITYLDSLQVVGTEYHVRSHVEPLFYRRAVRCLEEAKKIVEEGRKRTAEAISIVDEIESSAACIVFCVLCLEAYINFVAKDFCADEWHKINASRIRRKWIMVAQALGSKDCFQLDYPPYSDFKEVVDWRNQIVHYEHLFKKPELVHGRESASAIYSICNLENAQTAVKTVESMIRQLSKKTRIPLPSWLERSTDWLRLLP